MDVKVAVAPEVAVGVGVAEAGAVVGVLEAGAVVAVLVAVAPGTEVAEGVAVKTSTVGEPGVTVAVGVAVAGFAVAVWQASKAAVAVGRSEA